MRTHSSTPSTKADGFRRFEVITGVDRRRRWSDEDKARIVAESLDPATTASAVARRHGLHVSQLFTWRQQLQRRASAATELSGRGFVPILLAEDSAAPVTAAGRMEIALGSIVVRVGVDVDGPALRRVLEVVRDLP
jgi:transposase